LASLFVSGISKWLCLQTIFLLPPVRREPHIYSLMLAPIVFATHFWDLHPSNVRVGSGNYPQFCEVVKLKIARPLFGSGDIGLVWSGFCPADSG